MQIKGAFCFFNPFGSSFSALRTFTSLSFGKKLLTIALTSLTAIPTLGLACVGTFRYTTQWLSQTSVRIYLHLSYPKSPSETQKTASSKEAQQHIATPLNSIRAQYDL